MRLYPITRWLLLVLTGLFVVVEAVWLLAGFLHPCDGRCVDATPLMGLYITFIAYIVLLLPVAIIAFILDAIRTAGGTGATSLPTSSFNHRNRTTPRHRPRPDAVPCPSARSAASFSSAGSDSGSAGSLADPYRRRPEAVLELLIRRDPPPSNLAPILRTAWFAVGAAIPGDLGLQSVMVL